MKRKAEEYQTVRIWKKTHTLLKTLAAMQGASVVMLLNRLAEDELQRMREKKPDEPITENTNDYSFL